MISVYINAPINVKPEGGRGEEEVQMWGIRHFASFFFFQIPHPREEKFGQKSIKYPHQNFCKFYCYLQYIRFPILQNI